jgi:hypothetical protein
VSEVKADVRSTLTEAMSLLQAQGE